MVTYNDITLQDTDTTVTAANRVNGGTAMSLQANNIKYNVGVFTQTPQQPGKSTNQTHSNLLAYGDSLGFNNPQIIINGIINLGDYDESSGAAPANIISVKFLQQIYVSQHVFTLSDVYDSAPTTSIYRIHSLSGTFPSETISTIKVMCAGLTIESNTGVKEGAKVMYVLTLKEVRS